MSVHKTKYGTFLVRWRRNGKQKSKTKKRKIDADKLDAEKILGKDRELPETNQHAKCIAFGEFAEIFIRDYGEVHKTGSSLIRDKQVIRDFFLPSWHARPLNSITMRDGVVVQAMLKTGKRLAPKSVNNIMSVAHKIFEEAVHWDYIQSNPLHGLRRLKVPEADYRFWTFVERDRFLSYARAENFDFYRIVAVAVFTGLRRGEMEGLLRDALDFERREIIVKRSYCHKTHKLNEYTKSKKIRRVPMNDLVFKLLHEKALLPPSAQVLPGPYHNFGSLCMQPFSEAAGVSVIRFHDLRHTCASHLAMKGVSVFKIKELLGHQDLKTTMRYMHLAPGGLDGITDVLLGDQLENSPPSGEMSIANLK